MNDYYVVAIYETNKQYGGPEEGGWWYNTGEPVRKEFWRIFLDDDEAVAYYDELEGVVAAMNRDEKRRHPSSVLCDGWLEAVILENEMPEPYPKERPHYE